MPQTLLEMQIDHLTSWLQLEIRIETFLGTSSNNIVQLEPGHIKIFEKEIYLR